VFGKEQLESQNLEPCPACGLEPEVTLVEEIVVSTREEVRQLLAGTFIPGDDAHNSELERKAASAKGVNDP
jgi:hypothetical protein